MILTVVNEALVRYTDRESVLKAPALSIIERSAVLALSKICCVSASICAQHLDLLFRLVKSSIEFGVKANIIITIADMFNRFPNQMNERVKDIFELLHDRDLHVRQ
jgi:condensin complex subunit 1